MPLKPIRRSRFFMTLIGGFRCTGGYVLCADSQEEVTRDGFSSRVTRQKLEAKACGNFYLAIAGAGTDGDVIDACAEWIQQAVTGTQITSLPALKEFIQHQLRDFNKAHKDDFTKAQRRIELLIGASTRIPPHEAGLWISRATLLKDVNDYALTGYNDERYEHAVQNLYRPDLTMAQAVFLGISVILLAERTCNTVRHPIFVAIVKGAGGITLEKQSKIDALTTRVELFAAQFDQFFLTCPDTGLQPSEFAEKMNEFIRSIIHLRREYVEEWVEQAVEEGLDKIIEPYALIAPGTTLIVNPTPEQAAAQRQMLDGVFQTLREQLPHAQDKDQLVSNLETVRAYQQKVCDQCAGIGDAPTEEHTAQMYMALGEVYKAALMGAWKVNAETCNLLQHANGVMQRNREDFAGYVSPEMRLATEKLRLAVVERALAYVQRPVVALHSREGEV